MTKGAAGFTKLRDKHITRVNNRACNVVTLRTADGKVYEIEAEVVGYPGIPVMTLREKEEKKRA